MNTNDDQNLKKLTERLVAMSPEPPPFPEEVTMTTPSNSPTRNPMLVFAGAAVAVLIAIGVPFLFLSGDGPLAGPETSTTTSAPIDSTTTTDQPSTTATSVVDNIAYVRPVFLVTDSQNSFLGNPALVPFEATVYGSEDVDDLLLAVHLLGTISQPQASLPDGYFSAVPEDVTVNGIDYGADFLATVDMNEAFLDGAGGLLADFTMLNQIIYTVTANSDVNSVLFTVNGAPIDAFGSEGLELSEPVDRETFQEHLALIYVTSPILQNQDGNVVVQGISNTFEASMALRVIDSEGEIIHEEFTSATCGSGCWGDYLFVLDSDLFGPETFVQLFEYSAEDGDPQNIVTVPYNEGELWDFLS